MGSEEGTSRRFDVELFIVHPTIDPAEITAALGLASSHSHHVGKPRVTPKGTPLPSNYPDTRWRHCVEHEIKGQWFAEEIAGFVGKLLPHQKFLQELRATDGRTSLIIQFFGDYYGDAIPRDVLSKILALELDLGIECYSSPQGVP